MTGADLRELLRILVVAEQGLVSLKVHLGPPAAMLTEQTEFHDVAKLAYHADAMVCQAHEAVQAVRRELQYQVGKLPPEQPEEEPVPAGDEHEAGGIGA